MIACAYTIAKGGSGGRTQSLSFDVLTESTSTFDVESGTGTTETYDSGTVIITVSAVDDDMIPTCYDLSECQIDCHGELESDTALILDPVKWDVVKKILPTRINRKNMLSRYRSRAMFSKSGYLPARIRGKRKS